MVMSKILNATGKKQNSLLLSIKLSQYSPRNKISHSSSVFPNFPILSSHYLKKIVRGEPLKCQRLEPTLGTHESSQVRSTPHWLWTTCWWKSHPHGLPALCLSLLFQNLRCYCFSACLTTNGNYICISFLLLYNKLPQNVAG